MLTSIHFAPLVPWPILAVLGAVALILAGVSLAARARGGWLRTLLLAVAFLALANPTLVQEEREPLDDIALVVVDKSESQTIGERTAETETALATLSERLARYPNLETRVVTAGETGKDGTNLMESLARAAGEVDTARLAGAIMLTDGRVHDADALPDLGAPVHALVTGSPDEGDRKLLIEEAPSFGIVGETMSIAVRIDDDGTDGRRELAKVTISVDGEMRQVRTVATGATKTFLLPVERAGPTAIEIEVDEGPRELTLTNNRAALIVNGVRDRLRVLLVSGEPHSGERVWRNLLKADPAVDLVHFTILRPPEKQDGTPIRELSLIAFPTRQLFSTKLDEFDLIIFDRYKRRGVLPMLYLDNVSRYVEDGGAVLIAVGPAYSGPQSLHRTPIAAILPAAPTGEQTIGGFKPKVTNVGRRHPVTAPFAPVEGIEPAWGRWYRLIDVDRLRGDVVMSGPRATGGEGPLLILDRVGDGRVAQFLSDHVWLWARGFEGGGPQAELLRRLSHWLMKEPDLEEERLLAELTADGLRITRRTVRETVDPVTVIGPNGGLSEVTLAPEGDGTWATTMETGPMGLYKLASGELTAVAAVGPLNPREFIEPLSTTEVLDPVLAATGGATLRLAGGLPDIRRIGEGRNAAGQTVTGDWIGLAERNQHEVTDVRQLPLLTPLLAMALIIAAAMATWWREGR